MAGGTLQLKQGDHSHLSIQPKTSPYSQFPPHRENKQTNQKNLSMIVSSETQRDIFHISVAFNLIYMREKRAVFVEKLKSDCRIKSIYRTNRFAKRLWFQVSHLIKRV